MSWGGIQLLIDASSLVHAWDNYPIENFPRFWDWIESQFNADSLLISRIAYDEIGHVSPDCHQWLKKIDVDTIEVGNDIVSKALVVRQAVGVVEDNYHPKGVDENDVLIINTFANLGRIGTWKRFMYPPQARNSLKNRTQ